jgi:hydroxymethylpyrimidine pyrophosphatase-like HAD family hydrolase
MSNSFIFAIDFDGTIVKNEKDYVPRTLLPNAKEVINWAKNKGCYIIIWTVRSGDILKPVIDFLKANGVKYDAVNENYPELGIETSRKIYFDYCVDDHCCEKIDWLEIKKILKKKMIQKLADEIQVLSKEEE